MTDSTEPQLSPEAESSRYRPIKRLDESVVNRIAAGEIIHRPANALKELIENSLDAGATLIRITLKEGGIKMLQIQDNGSGIQPSDLPLLCERFATSKLRDFGDLESMSTFGFRGEALASISYVIASMNVVSKTRHQDCAYRAYYANGSLAPPKPGQSSDPKQCAGTDGTLITAEDLFYNVPQRRRALRSAADEYNRALDVVSKYAVHYGGKGVGFVCRKASSNATDLNTPSSPTASTLDTIRILHGNAVARELVELKDVVDDNLGFQCQGWISGANWSSKRTTMLCFINNRLVDCPLLKRSIEALYAALLPKGGHPWVYLSISINPANVDVNVHPTKKEVHFLHEDEIVERICQAAQDRLSGANSSRTFAFSQAVLPILAPDAGITASSSAISSRRDEQASRPTLRETRSHSSSSSSSSSSRAPSGSSSPAPVVRASERSGPVSSSKGYPQHLVRVDAKARTLDSMFASSSRTNGKKRAFDAEGPESSSISDVLMSETPAEDESESTSHRRAAMQSSDSFADSNGASSSLASMVRRSRQALSVRISDSDCSFTSIRNLRAWINKSQHRNLTEVVQNHTFVGVVDLDKGLSLIQHETRLLLVNHDAMIREFAFQLVLRQFGSLKRVRLEPAPSLDDLVRLGLENTAGVPEDDSQSIEATKDKIIDLLLVQAEMIGEYFSVCLDAEKRTLEGLPNLLPGSGGANGSAIELDRLPQLLVRLATRVDWDDEQECFETFARQLAWSCLPCPPPPPPPPSSSSGAASSEAEMAEQAKEARQEREAEVESAKKRVQHLWFDSMAKSRGRYVPSRETNEFVVQVANLPDLYRVFERC
ncbi:related to MLH1-DNA mismatch repair protein [Sporisorium reilianum f. sp. reilianum]|uniref:Related to MLH1-DNA mismatch repair protein n=1 Tax=Sporisorium reilianum f. sp. reilianum TaxID=72559 RepID=A0A2N8UC12_9BASI|nr:related to MLH1-DNA mismatch repair protein [Sporisorium reilianum f. sp. reilianum]DBA11296.1 TPA_inf: MLH1 [Sporisorium reilianum f. sp. reilianum]